MRVLLLPADQTACGNNRMIWPAQVLKDRGFDVMVQEDNESLWATVVSDKLGQDRVVAAGVNDDVDVIVVQRPCTKLVVDALEMVKVPVVIELDDDLKHVAANNAAFGAVHPKFSPDSNWQHLERAIRRADALIVTTPTLADRYGRNKDVWVVPNYVPERYLKIDGWQVGTSFGWPGNIRSHPNDLQGVRGAIQQVMRATGAEFRVVGPEGVERLIPGTVSTGWMEIDYAEEIACLDVGIAPLEDSVFNAAKSWLKPLEMAALGVPFVCSPRETYVSLALGYDIGWLAETPKQWKAALIRLLTDADKRAEVATLNRHLVDLNGLTIEERAEEWWNAWTAPLRSPLPT